MGKVKDKLREEVLSEYYEHLKKDKRIVKTIAIAGAVIGVLYFSKYFINAAAETVKACKNWRNAIRR